MSKTYTGTVKDLVKMNLTANGQKLDTAMLSVITRLGMARNVGQAPKPEKTRGKAATIWEISEETLFKITAVEDGESIPMGE